MRWILALSLVAAGCSNSGNGSSSCLRGPFDCWSATGECVLVTGDQGLVTVTWESGATAEGPVGMQTFTAYDPQGEACFERSRDGDVIVITAGSDVWRVIPGGDGATTVTCPDGSTKTHGPGEFPSNAPGIDPGVLQGCRIGGLCSRDADCDAGQVCCDHQCVTAERCPGTCEIDEHCGPGNRCCDGWCTSLPQCNMPCATDAQCDDGVYCNGAELCNGNRCQGVAPVNCDDSVSCTQDTCDEQAGRCLSEPDDQLCGPDQMCDPDSGCVDVIRCSSDADCDDQDACTAGTCTGGICAFEPVAGCCHQDADCDDGVTCNGEEACSNHACEAGSPPDCADAHACTTDRCDSARDECVHEPDSALCNQDEVCDPTQGCIDPAACVDDDYEENDAMADAAPVNVPVDEGAALLLEMCPQDDDWFVFNAPALSDVLVFLSYAPEMGEMDLLFFGTGGTPVGTKEVMDFEGSRMIFFEYLEIPVAQDFFVQVTGVGAVVVSYVLGFDISSY